MSRSILLALPFFFFFSPQKNLSTGGGLAKSDPTVGKQTLTLRALVAVAGHLPRSCAKAWQIGPSGSRGRVEPALGVLLSFAAS